MAKFHEKVLCLFHKDYKQLKKEADRRGLDYDGKEKTIAQIIWKDAYDAGIVEGKERAALLGTIRNCPANCRGNAKPEVKAYCLHDFNNTMKYRLELTEEQVRAIRWMIDYEFMTDVEFSEWDETFEDIGRI